MPQNHIEFASGTSKMGRQIQISGRTGAQLNFRYGYEFYNRHSEHHKRFHARQHRETPLPHEIFALRVLVLEIRLVLLKLRETRELNNEFFRESGAHHRSGQPPWDGFRHCPPLAQQGSKIGITSTSDRINVRARYLATEYAVVFAFPADLRDPRASTHILVLRSPRTLWPHRYPRKQCRHDSGQQS